MQFFDIAYHPPTAGRKSPSVADLLPRRRRCKEPPLRSRRRVEHPLRFRRSGALPPCHRGRVNLPLKSSPDRGTKIPVSRSAAATFSRAVGAEKRPRPRRGRRRHSNQGRNRPFRWPSTAPKIAREMAETRTKTPNRRDIPSSHTAGGAPSRADI